MAKRPSDHVVEEESAALKTVFLQRTTMSQADFGEKFGLGTQGNVWQYLSGHRPLNLRAAAAFARGLGVSIAEFSPRLQRERNTLIHAEDLSDATIADSWAPPTQTVPVISAVQAGAWNEATDPYPVGHGHRMQEVKAQVGPGAFALEVKGDSMAPRFPEGAVIVVDPSRRARPNDFVIARADDWDEATFKQYVIEAGQKLLKPLNERYPILQVGPHVKICGVVVEKIIRELF